LIDDEIHYFSTTVQSIVKDMKQSIHALSDMNFIHFWIYSGYNSTVHVFVELSVKRIPTKMCELSILSSKKLRRVKDIEPLFSDCCFTCSSCQKIFSK